MRSSSLNGGLRFRLAKAQACAQFRVHLHSGAKFLNTSNRGKAKARSVCTKTSVWIMSLHIAQCAPQLFRGSQNQSIPDLQENIMQGNRRSRGFFGRHVFLSSCKHTVFARFCALKLAIWASVCAAIPSNSSPSSRPSFEKAHAVLANPCMSAALTPLTAWALGIQFKKAAGHYRCWSSPRPSPHSAWRSLPAYVQVFNNQLSHQGVT